MKLEDDEHKNEAMKKEEYMARRRNATLTNIKFNLPWNISLSPAKKNHQLGVSLFSIFLPGLHCHDHGHDSTSVNLEGKSRTRHQALHSVNVSRVRLGKVDCVCCGKPWPWKSE